MLRLFVVIILAVGMLGYGALHAAEENQKQNLGVANNVETHIFKPPATPNQKAILVLHTSSGLRDADLNYAQKLANEGFIAVVPAFMKAYDIHENARQTTWTVYDKKIYADFLAVIQKISEETKISKENFYAVGFSNGGHWAALLASKKDVRAAVAYYGAYSEANTNKGLGRFRDSVTKNSNPTLILHGESDRVVDVMYARDLERVINRAGAKVEAHYFNGAGHSYERQLRDSDNQKAAQQSWDLTLKFLREN